MQYGWNRRMSYPIALLRLHFTFRIMRELNGYWTNLRRRITSGQHLLYCLLRQRRHKGVACFVGMESVVGEVSFQQAFVVHDCAEVVEIDQVVGGTVIF